MKKPVVLVVGTRPDAIKLLPLYKILRQSGIVTSICATNQHRELLDQVFDLFNVKPDISLDVMKPNQDLAHITSTVLQRITEYFATVQPALVVVQGDTSSSFAAGLAAFYNKIPVMHVEAGLRTGDIHAPFPEEINRIFLTKISTFHCAPTPLNVLHLLRDGVDQNKIFCVGNTVVDALAFAAQQIQDGLLIIDQQIKDLVALCKKHNKRMVLLTTHRRESFQGGIDNILRAMVHAAEKYKDLFIFFPVHPNPVVRRAVNESGLLNLDNVFCSNALSYQDLVFLLMSVDLAITDSGGIQEEAVSLGKQVIILRDCTERIEVVWEQMGVLVGTEELVIIDAIGKWYQSSQTIVPRFAYGDGGASRRIVKLIAQYLHNVDAGRPKERIKEYGARNV